MDYFIAQVRILLPVLGIDIFRGRETRITLGSTTSHAPITAEASPVFLLRNKKLGIDAQAQVVDGEFTVLAGSVVRATMPERTDLSESTARQYATRQMQHRKLVDDGSIVIGPDGVARLTRDVVFSASSTAGAVAQGTASLNGRLAWMTENGQTFGSWESASTEASLTVRTN